MRLRLRLRPLLSLGKWLSRGRKGRVCSDGDPDCSDVDEILHCIP